MERSNNSSVRSNGHGYDTPNRYLTLHVSNIQLLASIDSALALVTLIFNFRQVITSITNSPSGNAEPEPLDLNEFPNDFIISQEPKEEDRILHFQLIAASVASLCLTLTQLLLACLVMVSLSYISGDSDHDHDAHIIPKRARVVAGIWVVWSGLLFIALLIYVLSMRRFEDSSDKFYLFMLVSEIILRLIIVNYTTIFFCCRCRFKCS